jgi:hypothetical protein
VITKNCAGRRSAHHDDQVSLGNRSFKGATYTSRSRVPSNSTSLELVPAGISWSRPPLRRRPEETAIHVLELLDLGGDVQRLGRDEFVGAAVLDPGRPLPIVRTKNPTTATASRRTSKGGRQYLSVKRLNPTFSAAIYASLVATSLPDQPQPPQGKRRARYFDSKTGIVGFTQCGPLCHSSSRYGAGASW